MPTGVSGQFAGAHLSYKERVRIHTMNKDCSVPIKEIAKRTNMSYSTVWSAVSFFSLLSIFFHPQGIFRAASAKGRLPILSRRRSHCRPGHLRALFTKRDPCLLQTMECAHHPPATGKIIHGVRAALDAV